MSRRLVPTFAVAYYVAMVIFVTYPGYVPFNHIRPFVLGLPFSLFWQVLWICGAALVLGTVFAWERSRRRARERRGGMTDGGAPPPPGERTVGS